MAKKSGNKSKFSLSRKDKEMEELIAKTRHVTLALWSICCVERVISSFENAFPDDDRPRFALKTLQKWIDTGIFEMKVIRGASLNSHAAARDVGDDNAARSAARAAGQAVATAHVPAHCIAAANYSLQAIHRDDEVEEADILIAKGKRLAVSKITMFTEIRFREYREYLTMRIWSIHPTYLDWMGLGAQWREGILAQKVTEGKTKGWKNHPQLDRFKYHSKPMEAVGFYLKELYVESQRRGYNYNYSKIQFPNAVVKPIDLTQGQVEYEFNLLQSRLKKRTPKKYEENLKITILEAHPLFKIVPGLPEKWEKSYWREKED